MKLKKSHLIIILLLTLFFCCGLGSFKAIEGMETIYNKLENCMTMADKQSDPIIRANEHNKCFEIHKINLPSDTQNKDNKLMNNYNYSPQSNIDGNSYSNNHYSNINNTTDQIKTIALDDGRIVYATPQNTINGIPGKNIPPGQEDLYILKSQVVPPVCPACPTVINTGLAKSQCPPCPPCGRCPEAAFECVKKPTYKPDNPYLPVPVLSDFSSFGM